MLALTLILAPATQALAAGGTLELPQVTDPSQYRGTPSSGSTTSTASSYPSASATATSASSAPAYASASDYNQQIPNLGSVSDYQQQGNPQPATYGQPDPFQSGGGNIVPALVLGTIVIGTMWALSHSHHH